METGKPSRSIGTGRTYDKPLLIGMLTDEKPVPMATHGMRARLLGEGIATVTYHTAGHGDQVYCSSVGMKEDGGGNWSPPGGLGCCPKGVATGFRDPANRNLSAS